MHMPSSRMFSLMRINVVIMIVLLPFSLKSQKDLSLADYLDAVKQNNLRYIAEQYNVKIADAEAIAKRVFPDPEVLFEVSEEIYKLDLGYTLEFGKRRARIEVARKIAERERFYLEHFFQELRAEATEVYLDALLKKELWQVKQSSYEYMRQLSSSDSIRFVLGEINEIDMRQSKLEAATLYNDMLEKKADYQAALVLLNRYMGDPSDNQLTPFTKMEITETDYSLGHLLQIGEENRMDIMMAVYDNEASVKMFELVKAERRTDVGVHIGYERDWKWTTPYRNMITAGISIPLKFSNTNRGLVNSSRYAIEQSEVQLRDLRNQVKSDITKAYIRYGAVKEKIKQYNSGLLSESQKVLEGVVFRYMQGETRILEVLVAQRTHNDIRERYYETVKEYFSAHIELQRSCGVWNI